MASHGSSVSSKTSQEGSTNLEKQHQEDLLVVENKDVRVNVSVEDAENTDGDEENEVANLPRADGGRDAWLFLAGCFVFEALVWVIIVVAALIGSSFSTQVWQLILTQGVLYAIGGSLLYAPTMFYLDEWFIKRKGLAFGIMWAGVGTSGVIFPFLLTALLTRLGYANTLRIWSLILLLLCSPLIYFVKARLPVPSPPPPRQPISYSFFKTRTFIFLQLSNVLESLGFFMPSIYLPSYALSLGFSSTSSTLLLSLLNSFSVLGAITLGGLCDYLHVTTVIFISTLGSTLSIFLFWGLGVQLPMLVVFAATYGFFAGGYSAIWSGMMKEVKRGSPTAGMGTLMGIFAAGRGVGMVEGTGTGPSMGF
ncbi:hypothetical protein G7Y89_g9186 [Cudoniella acicularis]|uniref:Major facilitator superfamily (MFS) profile domain-containing protein n=1 Tax=Cudoniella acicularis TaxID=354080 RepID=A0A8H4RHF6_9HELO|nr:hypothetical protein G7Y89_g9186 [Cudoniella acicularis]